jgi:hypothetical protein
MIYLKTFESYKFNNILYHGTEEEHTFDDIGYIVEGTFFSESIDEARGYGKYLYRVAIGDIEIFDSLDVNSMKKLFGVFDALYDRYSDSYITDPIEFVNSSDTWDGIENTRGVINWIKGEGYRGTRITEGGVSNIILFYPKEDIIEYNLISTQES